MQDKEDLQIWPQNEKGEYHGYHDVIWTDGGWYKGYYINGVEAGLFQTVWFAGNEPETEYYAR